MAELREADGSRTTWTYDKANQRRGKIRAGTGAVAYTNTLDAAGNQTRERNTVYTTTRTWDDENRVVRNWTTSPLTPGVISRTTLTYDGDGMVTGRGRANITDC